MAEKKYLPPKNLVNPFIKNLDEYDEMYQESISDPQTFFGDQAEKNLSWVEPFSNVHNGEFVDSKWFDDGKINIHKSMREALVNAIKDGLLPYESLFKDAVLKCPPVTVTLQ